MRNKAWGFEKVDRVEAWSFEKVILPFHYSFLITNY